MDARHADAGRSSDVHGLDASFLKASREALSAASTATGGRRALLIESIEDARRRVFRHIFYILVLVELLSGVAANFS